MTSPEHLRQCLTDVPGIEVGHYTLRQRLTGCSVVLARGGAVCGVDVRGAAPGTRETDLLTPGNLVDKVHAVLLAGGSAYGLDAATGVMRWLEENDIGLDVGPHPADAAKRLRVPIVPAAVLFDLWLGDGRIRPDAQAGYLACQAAGAAASPAGNVGAGAGATVGKLFGTARAMKGGIGSASLRLHGVTTSALIACNAAGDVLDAQTGALLAGARVAEGSLDLLDTRQALLGGEMLKSPLRAGTNTTIGVIATDALLDAAQAKKLAQLGHDGLARSINPVHSLLDGDTLFALATGASGQSISPLLLGVIAAEVVALAVANAVRAAQGLRVAQADGGVQWLPAWSDR
jgi:L-aminopeptidase/D-esterase-like protein